MVTCWITIIHAFSFSFNLVELAMAIQTQEEVLPLEQLIGKAPRATARFLLSSGHSHLLLERRFSLMRKARG
jgi:hypothetical protein